MTKPTHATDRFVDTNILLYLLSSDARMAGVAEEVLIEGGVISAQVMNEFARVALRKFMLPWPELRPTLAAFERQFIVEPVTLHTHRLALDIAERYRTTVFDSALLAAAILAGCNTFVSEDMQHGQVIEGLLTIRNPFL